MAKGMNIPGDERQVLLSEFDFTAEVDPIELGVNIRFKENTVMHPRAKRGQAAVVASFRRAVQEVWMENFRFDFGQKTDIQIDFFFKDRRGDLDGPIKRTIDAIEMAMKSLYYDWHDGRVYSLGVNKHIDKDYPRIEVEIRKLD